MIVSDSGDVETARKLDEKTDLDVWLPLDPLCTDHCVPDAYEMAFRTYQHHETRRRHHLDLHVQDGFSEPAVQRHLWLSWSTMRI